ncbi:MAG: 4-hydroxybenzoyl-CoA reductase subunit gamma [Pseudomonadota bacterium]
MSGSRPVERKIRMSFEVNGEALTIVVEPRTTLADALREACGLAGTPHTGGGECGGSTTVLVDGEPVFASLMFAVQAHGTSVRTVDAPAGDRVLDAVRSAFKEHGASRSDPSMAGYVMQSVGALERNPDLDDEGVEDLLAGGFSHEGQYDSVAAAIRTARTLAKRAA